MDSREDRRHSVGDDDQRNRFARDRDRILYSSAFHRLSGVTQIVRAGEEDIFHTRQQHSIKVAQIGRRLAEHLLSSDEGDAHKDKIDPEVVEAACLAHDLGHPPFGHAGEAVLDDLVQNKGKNSDTGVGEPDGFEGNAQTFRILTKLSVRHEDVNGLNLTRATLAAVLKYPWMRNHDDKNKKKKWSAYKTEEADFDFARKSYSHEDKTVEAGLMDWADDIAYSVHDLEDFHRCNAIPWHIIFHDEGMSELVKNTLSTWHNSPPGAEKTLENAIKTIKNLFDVYGKILREPYVGSRKQRQWLRDLTSTLISRYLNAISLEGDEPKLKIAPLQEAEVLLLKQITRDYIFTNPALVAQQEGQAKLIKDLFNIIYDKCEINSFPRFLPQRLNYLWELSKENNICKDPKARFAADCIASLTENEVIGLHSRLFGSTSGSVLHPIVR